MQQLAIPSTPVARENRKVYDLEPFQMPEVGEDQLKVYVTTFKKGSPFDEKHIGGVTFRSFVLPSDWSLREKANEQHFPQIPTVLLTEKQAAAILARAKLVHDRTPRIENSEGVTPAKNITLDEHILLVTSEEYISQGIKENTAAYNLDPEAEVNPLTADGIKDELISQQSKTRKGKK